MKRFKRAKDIQVGVIGYGPAFHMGKAHLNEMKNAGMTPVAACDVDPERLRAMRSSTPSVDHRRAAAVIADRVMEVADA